MPSDVYGMRKITSCQKSYIHTFCVHRSRKRVCLAHPGSSKSFREGVGREREREGKQAAQGEEPLSWVRSGGKGERCPRRGKPLVGGQGGWD